MKVVFTFVTIMSIMASAAFAQCPSSEAKSDKKETKKECKADCKCKKCVAADKECSK